jgi:hypothetical protein
MAKSFEDLRTQTRKVLEELSCDDAACVESWMKSFDQQHGRKTTQSSKVPTKASCYFTQAGQRSDEVSLFF